jgi:hypothetical protein
VATIAELITRHGVDVLEHLDRQIDVPVLTGLQAQGDVIVIPQKGLGLLDKVDTPVPSSGVAVVRGENGGNTHLLLADQGPVFYSAAAPMSTSLKLGTLVVPEGSTALLAHPEHGYAGIGPGRYEVRRQREQADEIRLVAD